MFPSVSGKAASASTTQLPTLGRSLGYPRKGRWALLPPETAGQRDGGSRQGLSHSGLHQLLQGLRVSSPNWGAQVLVVLEPCGQHSPSSSESPTPQTQQPPQPCGCRKGRGKGWSRSRSRSYSWSTPPFKINSYLGITIDSHATEGNKIPGALYPTPPTNLVS